MQRKIFMSKKLFTIQFFFFKNSIIKWLRIYKSKSDILENLGGVISKHKLIY